MTTIAGCDHHDQTGLVPDNRSRARMLDQFAAASAFGRAFFQMVLDADLDLSVVTPTGVLRPQPTITIETEKFLQAWTAYMAWREQEPRGDDLLPPFTRGSEIRVPPDEIADPPEGATEKGVSGAGVGSTDLKGSKGLRERETAGERA